MSRDQEFIKGEKPGESIKTEAEMSRRELLRRFSPLGKLRLDSSRCTGCGLCVEECSTDGLAILSSQEGDAFEIMFKHGQCIACGQCAEICPEKCLEVERCLVLDNLKTPEVLFEDRLIRCSKCGAPLGPKSMIDKLQAKIASSGELFPSQFELCPECKANLNFQKLRI